MGKVDAGYYPRQVGEKGELSKNDRREQRKRKILDLRSQLDRAAQIIVAKDNDLERLDKEKEKLQQAYNRCLELGLGTKQAKRARCKGLLCRRREAGEENVC